MATVYESANAQNQTPGDIAGLRLLAREQQISFVRYVRHVLPLDGFVYWLRTTASTVSGSLHYSIDKRQNEDETIAINRVVFTTGQEVQPFNEISPDVMWVGEHAGIRFAFVRAGDYYHAAGLYHYVGEAVYPALANTLVDAGSQLSDATLVVSNSLPAWLALKTYDPIWLRQATWPASLNPFITLYPSFAVPDNLQPPYGSVHIEPAATTALQDLPTLSNVYRHDQLAADEVRITLYGLTNDVVMGFYDTVIDYMTNYDVLGLMSTPVVHDEKRTQAELGVLAMKKTIDFRVSYYQTSIRNLARQLILQAPVTVTATPNPLT